MKQELAPVAPSLLILFLKPHRLPHSLGFEHKGLKICMQGLLLLQEQFHLFSCLSEDSRNSGQKYAASDVSGFVVNPKALEPQEKSLADLCEHHIEFSACTEKPNKNCGGPNQYVC